MIKRRTTGLYNPNHPVYILTGYNDGMPVKLNKTSLQIEMETCRYISEHEDAFCRIFHMLGTTGAVSFLDIFRELKLVVKPDCEERMSGFFLTADEENGRKSSNAVGIERSVTAESLVRFDLIFREVKKMFEAISQGIFDDVLRPTDYSRAKKTAPNCAGGLSLEDFIADDDTEAFAELIFGTDGSAYGEESLGSDI